MAVLLAAALVTSGAALQMSQKVSEAKFFAKTAQAAEQKCLANNVRGAMQAIALSIPRRGQVGMAQDDLRRVLDACFLKQGVLGDASQCKLGSQHQCDWVHACVNENKCDSSPLPQVMAQLKETLQTPDGKQSINGDGPKVWKYEGTFPKGSFDDKYPDSKVTEGLQPKGVWIKGNPLANLALTLSSATVSGELEGVVPDSAMDAVIGAIQDNKGLMNWIR